MKLIGKGAFTKAYLRDDGKVYLKSSDPIKECMANGWFPNSGLFPKVEYSSEGDGYVMGYYPRVSSLKNNLDKDQYELYKNLRKLANSKKICTNSNDSYHELYKLFSAFEDIKTGTALLEALDACSNYGSDIGFEVSPRDVAVKDGKLILMDCFFSISALLEVRGYK